MTQRRKIKSGRSDKTDTCEFVRTKQIHIRASEDEFKAIEKQATEQRKSIAKFLRDKALNIHTNKKYKSSDEMFLTVSLLNQVKKIGTNINQIAYKLNSNSSTKEDIAEFKNTLSEFKQLIKRVV